MSSKLGYGLASLWRYAKSRIWSSEALVVALLLLLLVQVYQNQTLLSQCTLAEVTAQEDPYANLIGQAVSLPPARLIGGGDWAPSKSRSTLYVFFHPECKYCRADQGLWTQLSKRTDRYDFDVVGVSIDEDVERTAAYVSSQGLEFPVILDQGAVFARAFGVSGTPTKVLVDSSTTVRKVWRGLTTQRSDPNDLIDLLRYFGVEASSLPAGPPQ